MHSRFLLYTGLSEICRNLSQIALLFFNFFLRILWIYDMNERSVQKCLIIIFSEGIERWLDDHIL